MTVFVASMIVLAFIAVGLLPLGLAWLKPRAGWWVLSLYVSLLFGLVAARTDFTGRLPSLDSLPQAKEAENLSPDTCSQALAIAEQGRIIIDMRSPPQVIVDRRLWQELPQQVQAAIVSCLERSNRGGGSGAIRIVEQ